MNNVLPHKLGAALVAISTLIVVIVVPPAIAGGLVPPTVPSLGLILEENFDIGTMPSILVTDDNQNQSTKQYICETLNDPFCVSATWIQSRQLLPVCSVDETVACISKVWAKDSVGKIIQGIYQKSVPENFEYDREALPQMSVPASRGLGGLWKIPGVFNSGGEDSYFVAALNMSWGGKKSGEPLSVLNFGFENLRAAITPTKLVTGNYVPLKATDARAGRNLGSNGLSSTPSGERCAVADVGVCHVVMDFPLGYRFGMTVKLNKGVSGWFHGRISLPDISTKPWGKGIELSIEAEPVSISTLNFTVPNSEIPQTIRDLVFTNKEFGVSGTRDGGIQLMDDLSSSQAMTLMNGFLPAIKEKASKTTGYWSFKALNQWNLPDVQRCSKGDSQLAGVVNTNALLYSSGPPAYNKDLGTLEYKVASPHFQSDGAVARGTYDLALRSDVARCIYGFSSAPIQASISIVSEEGEAKLATTVINERDGWLYLSAKGFTFSSPIIKVKLSQEVVEPATASAGTKNEVKNPSLVKKSIVCVKGKLTKRITALNPKCPNGYKIKK